MDNITVLSLGKCTGIFIMNKNGSQSDATVSFCDINRDGVDEMFFVESNEKDFAIIPHVYTFINGNAEEIRVDNSSVSSVKKMTMSCLQR